MAYDKVLEERLKSIFVTKELSVESKKMFGGQCFLYKGKMTVGIIKDRLVVRVIESKLGAILKEQYASPMDFTGRKMKEFAFISEEGFKSDFQLEQWIELGVEHAKTKLKEL